jgi:hypothetical protein
VRDSARCRETELFRDVLAVIGCCVAVCAIPREPVHAHGGCQAASRAKKSECAACDTVLRLAAQPRNGDLCVATGRCQAAVAENYLACACACACACVWWWWWCIYRRHGVPTSVSQFVWSMCLSASKWQALIQSLCADVLLPRTGEDCGWTRVMRGCWGKFSQRSTMHCDTRAPHIQGCL